MFKSELFKRTFLLLVLISVLNFLGDILYLHWILWWYDVLLHLLSGVSVGMAFMVFGIYYLGFLDLKKPRVIFITFLAVFTVGVLWEIFELYIGATSFADGNIYVLDTISDIIADVSGGFFGTLYGFLVNSKISSKINTNAL